MNLEQLINLQEVVLLAAEGIRNAEAEADYTGLRRQLLADGRYSDAIPSFVRRHRDLASMWPALKSFAPQWEPRRQEIRHQFEPALQLAEDIEAAADPRTTDSSAWTGAISPAERTIAVKTLLPVAIAAVDQLIDTLETPGHNGGPPRDETVEAIANLRALHTALGELLTAADEGRLQEAFAGGLPVEIARFAKRAAKNLRDDPLPYAMSALFLSICSACGISGIGGYLSGVAMAMKRK
ncbi:hypothetical protein [Sphingomonas hankookensis]|uniref:hypothetical protein n=1 Tax=Sphingomonas hankookensis TaxID=563996 RepID=UPI00234EF1EE|nr:hypothetical protein [Sphingomonas hankookensis]WCP71534.1 hypothetical protein PPZ50_14415 [Sphingomonas hankookensis]